MRARDFINEASIGTVLTWPEFVNNISKILKASGWTGQRQGDDVFVFSSRGYETEDQYYIVIIENLGQGVFAYGLGTVEDGDPYIDDSFKGQLPTTLASISELNDLIRDSFGLGENINEKWSEKYKRSIDCSNPKGFSQKAHCAGRKKRASESIKPVAPAVRIQPDKNRPQQVYVDQPKSTGQPAVKINFSDELKKKLSKDNK